MTAGGQDELARWVEGLVEGRRGTLVQQKRERQVFGVPGYPWEYWAKRGWGSKRAEVRREAENARAFAALGLGPTVLAAGPFEDAWWLVLEDARGWSLHDEPDPESASNLRAVAPAVRRLHDAGFAWPDMSAGHTFLDGEGVRFIDVARARRLRGPATCETRARDLAALLFSVRGDQTRSQRVRFCRDATGLLETDLARLLGRVDAYLAKLWMRTRWRHDFTIVGAEYFDEHSGARHDRGLRVHFPADVWDPCTTDFVRRLPDRENRTFGRQADGRPRWYLKVFPPTKSGWSPAMRELAAIDLFQRAGILVNRVAAYAEDVDKGSLIAVSACRGEPLDDLLRRGVSVAERRALAVQTARIWRRMRERGLRHRDAYPCHLFAAPWPGQPLRFELRLIDLTRAGPAPFPKERWFVKDAAALWHGLPKPPVTRTDAVRWLREYFRVPKLTREAKRFARRVGAKERRIAARQARKAARR